MFILPDLPYAPDALQPVLSADLMRLHHDRHHQTYVTNMNKILEDAGRKPASLEAVVREAAAAGEKKLFNNAGQTWNHAFFWLSMTPAPAKPQGALAEAIQRDFGGLDGLKTRFVDEGVGHFGSGWVWLVARGGKLEVISTHDGETAITQDGVTPILVCDVWEHAYYLDYQPNRKGFLEAWFDGLADWGFAGEQFAAAQGAGAGYRYPAPA